MGAQTNSGWLARELRSGRISISVFMSNAEGLKKGDWKKSSRSELNLHTLRFWEKKFSWLIILGTLESYLLTVLHLFVFIPILNRLWRDSWCYTCSIDQCDHHLSIATTGDSDKEGHCVLGSVCRSVKVGVTRRRLILMTFMIHGSC